MEGYLVTIVSILVTLLWLWYFPDLIHTFRRTRLARKYELYQLEKKTIRSYALQ